MLPEQARRVRVRHHQRHRVVLHVQLAHDRCQPRRVRLLVARLRHEVGRFAASVMMTGKSSFLMTSSKMMSSSGRAAFRGLGRAAHELCVHPRAELGVALQLAGKGCGIALPQPG